MIVLTNFFTLLHRIKFKPLRNEIIHINNLTIMYRNEKCVNKSPIDVVKNEKYLKQIYSFNSTDLSLCYTHEKHNKLILSF